MRQACQLASSGERERRAQGGCPGSQGEAGVSAMEAPEETCMQSDGPRDSSPPLAACVTEVPTFPALAALPAILGSETDSGM